MFFFPPSHPQPSFSWGVQSGPKQNERSDRPVLSISQRNGCRPWKILFGQRDSHRGGSFHNVHASAPLDFCNTQSTWSRQRERRHSADFWWCRWRHFTPMILTWEEWFPRVPQQETSCGELNIYLHRDGLLNPGKSWTWTQLKAIALEILSAKETTEAVRGFFVPNPIPQLPRNLCCCYLFYFLFNYFLLTFI